MSGATINVTPGSGQTVQGSTSSAGNLLQSVGIEDKDSGVVQSIYDAGAGQHAGLVAGAYKEYSGLSAGALNADLQPSTDVSAYKMWSLHITGTYSGTLSFQGSNNNTSWVSVPARNFVASGVEGQTTTSTDVFYVGPVAFRYLRIRMTTYASGTANAVLELYTEPNPVFLGVNAGQTGSWTFGSSSSTGSAVPSTAHYLGGNLGGNLSGIYVLNAVNGQGVVPGMATYAYQMLYNGTNVDAKRSNEGVSLLSNAARTTTQTSADLINYNGIAALDIMLNVSSAGSGSITLSVDAKDPGSGAYYNLLTGTAVTTSSLNRYRINPYIPSAANSVAQDVVPRTFRIVVTHNNANSITYAVGYSLTRS